MTNLHSLCHGNLVLNVNKLLWFNKLSVRNTCTNNWISYWNLIDLLRSGNRFLNIGVCVCSWTCFTKNSVLIFKSVNLILHRPTPIWGVSEGAQKVEAGPRLVSLSQHKEPHPQYLFDRTAYMTVCILYFILLFKSYQINEQIQDVENSFACCILISFPVHVIWFCHNSMLFYFARNKTNLKLVSVMWYILVIKYCSNWK